jgi:uncharacterized Zn finger protein
MELQQPRINLRESETIKCENCGNIYFREVIYLKKVSKIITGTAEDTTVPFPIYKCDKCDHINEGFNPFEEPETKVINE